MILKSFFKAGKQIPFVLLLLAGITQNAAAQGLEPVEQPWYVGAGLGTSFGQCTFRSITQSDMHWGFQGVLTGGYRMNRLISFEAGLQFGSQTQTSPDGYPYWLSADGERYVSPVINRKGWYYRDIECSTGWTKILVQANIDGLGLFMAPDCRWSFNVSPQLSVITTKSTFVTPDDEVDNDRQWHLGLGAQISLGYQVNDDLGVALFSGVTCLTGKRFDNIPDGSQKGNSIWDTGIKVTYRLAIK